MSQTIQPQSLLLRILLRLSHNNQSRWQNLQMLRIPPRSLGPSLDISIKRLRRIQILGRAKHHFRRLSRQLPSSLTLPRLHNHRPPLHRPRDIQRSSDFQIISFMIEHMHFLRIKIQPALLITHKRVVCKRVPQPGNNVVELACTLVPV